MATASNEIIILLNPFLGKEKAWACKTAIIFLINDPDDKAKKVFC